MRSLLNAVCSGFLLCIFLAGGVIGTTDPSNLACSAINSTAITVTWTQATDVTVLGYHLDCERVDGLVVEPDIPTAVLADKTYDTHDIGGLGKYGVYGVTIHSYTSGGNLTDFYINCTTAEDVPGYTSASLDCAGITISAIQCTWLDMEQVYWNGIPTGWRLQYLSTNMSEMTEMTTAPGTLTATAAGLTFGTSYILLLSATTSVGPGTMYISTIASTLGYSTTTEEPKQKHFCYEAFPGYLEFGWEEMPCTIYTGTIAGLFLIVIIFISIFACQACCSKSGGGKMMLNIENQFEDGGGGGRGGRRKRRQMDDDYDDDDEYDDDGVPPKKGGRDDDDDYPTESDELSDDDDEDDDMENRGVKNAVTPLNLADCRDPASPEPEKQKPRADTQARDDSAAMGRRQQSGVSLDGALSSRQIELDEAEGVWSDSDYDSQYDSYDEDEEGELSDTVPPLPAALAARAKKNRTKTASQHTTTSTGARPKTSKPGTKTTAKQTTTKTLTILNSTETKNKDKTENDSKNKLSKPESVKTQKKSKSRAPSANKNDVKATPKVIVTKASVHFEISDEQSSENEDVWGDDSGNTNINNEITNTKTAGVKSHGTTKGGNEPTNNERLDNAPHIYDQSSSGFSEDFGGWGDEQTEFTGTKAVQKHPVDLASNTHNNNPGKHEQKKHTSIKGVNRQVKGSSKVGQETSMTSNWDDDKNVTSDWDDPVEASVNSPTSEWDEPDQNDMHASEWNDNVIASTASMRPHVTQPSVHDSKQVARATSNVKTNNKHEPQSTNQTIPGSKTHGKDLPISGSQAKIPKSLSKTIPKSEAKPVTAANSSKSQTAIVKNGELKSEWDDDDDEDEMFTSAIPVNNRSNQSGVNKPSSPFQIQPTHHTVGKRGSNHSVGMRKPASSPSILINNNDALNSSFNTQQAPEKISQNPSKTMALNLKSESLTTNPNTGQKNGKVTSKNTMKTSHSVPANMSQRGTNKPHPVAPVDTKGGQNRILVSRKGGSNPRDGLRHSQSQSNLPDETHGPNQNTIGVSNGKPDPRTKGKSQSVSIEMENFSPHLHHDHNSQTKLDADVDLFHLPNEDSPRVSDGSKILTRSLKSPRAWATDSRGKLPGGRKTPVKQFNIPREWTAIDIEPVRDTNRLGKKFPFLDVSPVKSGPKAPEQSVSNSKKIIPGQAQKLLGANDTNKNIPASEAGQANNSSANVFYGFGVGRFRMFASKWLAKMRFKKNPVETVPSVW